MTLGDILRSFFGLQPIPGAHDKERDLIEFRAAKARLKKSSKTFIKEIDQFGDLVHGMREIPDRHLPDSPPATKKNPTRQARGSAKRKTKR